MKKFFATALILLCAAPASAEDCSLKLLASLDIVIDKDGDPIVPVSVAGKEYAFALEFDSMLSAMVEKVATEAGAEKKHIHDEVAVDGQTIRTGAIASSIKIGNAVFNDAETMLLPDQMLTGADGILGLDLLSRFDVELDLSARKLNLFAQKHCAGNVVYWGKPYTVIPFYSGAVTNIFFDAALDGKSIPATFSTGREMARLGTADAQKYLGIDPADPRLQRRLAMPGANGTEFSYPFTNLTVGAIAITNPDITVYAQSPSEACNVKRDDLKAHFGEKYCISSGILLLGRKELRALHLYFAFSEKKLYVSAADPAPPLSTP